MSHPFVASLLLFSVVGLGVPARTMAQEPPAPGLTFAFEAFVELGPPMELGDVRQGRRRIIPIVGGTFEGPNIRGTVLNNGADWQIVRPDGFAELDTRYALQTDSGHIIYVQNKGVRHAAPEIMRRINAGEMVDPEGVYFRTMATFETSAPELQWLAQSIFIGSGERRPSDVVIRFWKVE